MGRRRALCVTSNYPRWAGDTTTPFVHNLAVDLRDVGWDVDVLAPHFPRAAMEERLDGVRVQRFRYAYPEAAQTVCYQGGAMVNLRKRPHERLKLPALVAAEFAALLGRLRGGEYDLVHSHWLLPQGFTATVARLVLGTPHVATVHGGDVFSLRGPVMDVFKRAALLGADAVTANSTFTARAVEQLLAPRRLERIPMGVAVAPPTDDERARSEDLRASHRGEGPLLVFVGRLVDEKGPEDAVRATALLRERGQDARLLLVGEGQDRPDVEALAARMSLGSACTFVGWVPQSQLRSYYAAADAVVLPSRTGIDGWVEAQGLTVLEAMAAGAPVIATRLGGIVDSIDDGRTGWLVPERSPDAIAEAVERLTEDPDLSRSLGKAARRRVDDGFSRTASARAFGHLFDDVIASRR